MILSLKLSKITLIPMHIWAIWKSIGFKRILIICHILSLSIALQLFNNVIGMPRSPIALLGCSDDIAFKTSVSAAGSSNILLVRHS